MTSIRFDFPLPFGPIRMFSGRSSIGSVFGPKERRFRGWIDFRIGRAMAIYCISYSGY
jgi:hypothetical protein